MAHKMGYKSGKSMAYKGGQSISGKSSPSYDKSMSSGTISNSGSVGPTYYEQEKGGMKKKGYGYK